MPARSANHLWALCCNECDAEFSDRSNVSIIETHFALEHPDVEGIHLTTVWRGKGPAPATPDNRAARRAAARRDRGNRRN